MSTGATTLFTPERLTDLHPAHHRRPSLAYRVYRENGQKLLDGNALYDDAIQMALSLGLQSGGTAHITVQGQRLRVVAD